jgi:phage/plasmid-associated DNA primase
LVWFEELSSSNKDFREYMDKMKSAITDGCITSRALYKEFQKTRNTNEYIAASNHLVGVLEDRMTVFDLNTEKKGDTEWYAELRAVCTPAVLMKFVTYLKQFTTALPMKPLQTEIFKTMDSNSSEPIAEYINELAETRGHDFARFHNGNATYSMIDDMFEHYTSWARTANEKQLPRSKFKAKVLHFGASNITWDRVRHNNGVRPHVFKFVDGYFTHADDIIEVI